MKSIIRGLTAAVALGCLAAGAGCIQKTSGTEVSGVMVTTPDGNEELSRAVIVNNAKLARSIQVVDVRHEYKGDLLKASITVASKYAGTLKFQYKLAWFNAAGIEVNPDTDAWTPAILYGNEVRTVEGLAPNPDVTAFKVKIRN